MPAWRAQARALVTTHAETYALDPISGLPVVQMRLTNTAPGDPGGERLAVHAVVTWPSAGAPLPLRRRAW